VPDLGGAGSVLLIWSLLIVVIGAALFAYSVVVTLRGRRRRRRRRLPVAPAVRPMPPRSAARPFALPSGPTAGGRPVDRHIGRPRPGPPPQAQPRALPAAPTSRQLALPAAGQRYPSPPPPVAFPSAGAPPALPAGPVVGSGYGGSGYAGSAYGGSGYAGPGYADPASYPQPPAQPPASYGTPASSAVAAISAAPAPYSTPPAPHSTPPAPHSAAPDPYSTPPAPHSAAPDPYSTPPAPHSAAPDPYSTPPAPHSTPPASHSAGPDPYSTPPTPYKALPGYGDVPVNLAPPQADRKRPKSWRRSRNDECATLRAECEQLRSLAASAAAAAAQAATKAETAHAEFLAARHAADEARGACEAIAREMADVSAQIANLERVPTGDEERLQAETSHAAFAAYRRGDISSEQLREVFKRAEGWTPEHDRLSRRANELRTEEAEAQRTRDTAVQALQAAGEQARTATISAQELDRDARTAAIDARGRCAAADACEKRRRR
jgi:hypothetical protein